MKKTATYLFLIPAFVVVIAALSCNSNSSGSKQHQYSSSHNPDNAMQPAGSETTDAPLAGTDSDADYVDTFRIKMDSLLKAKIVLPPVYTHDVLSANDEAAARFTELSKACHGKMKILVNARLVAQEITATIKSASIPESDLLILIDKTYSMVDDIANVKSGLNQIIEAVKKRKGTRLAIAFYGDKNCDGLEWYSFRNFETNYDSARQYLNSVKVTGGGDIPESVYDAVMKSLEQDFWRSKKRCNIILVGDAPPLEKPLSDYTLNDVITRARASKTIMNFYPIIIMPEIKEVKLPPSEVVKYKETMLSTSLYPNPSRGQVNVGLKENGSYYMEMYNPSGQMILSEEFYGISWSKELGDIPNGMYILRVIKSDHTFELMKFILQR